MSEQSDLAHCATALVNVDARKAFAFMADPLQLGTWSLGCLRTQAPKPQGPFTGTSMYDDSQVWFNIEAHPELLLIDYLIGEPGNFKPRISARIIAAETCGLLATQCYVSLIAWRPAQMAADRWARLCASHEAEIWLIKARLEGPATARDTSI